MHFLSPLSISNRFGIHRPIWKVLQSLQHGALYFKLCIYFLWFPKWNWLTDICAQTCRHEVSVAPLEYKQKEKGVERAMRGYTSSLMWGMGVLKLALPAFFYPSSSHLPHPAGISVTAGRAKVLNKHSFSRCALHFLRIFGLFRSS